MTVTNFNSFTEMLSLFENINRWLSDGGITAKSDRFRLQLKAVQIAAKAEERNNLIEYMQGVDPEQRATLLWAITELTELGDVYKAFPVIDSALSEKIRIAMSGPSSQKLENSTNNAARNTMFELGLAARMKRGGLQVDIGQENPDIIVSVPSGTIFVQCKRPLSSRTVRENVNSAATQLRRDLKSAKQSFGVIALSMSKSLLELGEFRITSHEAGAHAFAEQARLEVERHRKDWSNVGDKNVVGVLFHAIYPVAVTETHSMMAAQTIVHSSIAGRRTQPFDELVQRLPE
jgi:hypothetical protein